MHIAVMAKMSSNGNNKSVPLGNRLMKELEQEQPYILTGIGFDYMKAISLKLGQRSTRSRPHVSVLPGHCGSRGGHGEQTRARA
jgi:hypothetical protein